MVDNKNQAWPSMLDLPPPYLDYPIHLPPYVESSLPPPPPYVEPLIPPSTQQCSPIQRCYRNVRNFLTQSIIHPFSQIDLQSLLKMMAVAEAMFAGLILLFSIVITQLKPQDHQIIHSASENSEFSKMYLYHGKFCKNGQCDGYCGIFFAIFNILFTTTVSFIVFGFSCCRYRCLTVSPSLTNQTNNDKIIVRVYLSFLVTSILCNGCLVTILCFVDVTIIHLILFIVTVVDSKFIILGFQ